ncbi:hypothetical protein SAMN04488546_2314 [Geodermatophilus poikilotrophus]|uniref:Polyketide cyclase / dehydrase and lipid transport n=1 Tax=Geodermatophilus poikilotrophus TaxID=1333667 RepID=A0A1I0E321_9ACTN|nr:hypothetical protein SAMN04488546_2314 [Geodermatophilus poikilotrophus]
MQDGPVERPTTIDVETSAERVWKVVREAERWPERSRTVMSERRLDDGPLARLVSGPGGVAPDTPTEHVETELEPRCSFTWVATGPGGRTIARHVKQRSRSSPQLMLSVEAAEGWTALLRMQPLLAAR